MLMEPMGSKANPRQVIRFACAYIAFMMGSGFATGQEILQYYAAYGRMGFLAVLVTCVLLTYVSVSFMTTGYRMHFDHGSRVFKHYCGAAVGGFFDCFTVLAIYLSVVVLLSGAGATLNQQYGLNRAVGILVMAALAAATVLLGFGRIVSIIGKIGPVIIAFVITIGLITAIQGIKGVARADAAIANMNVLHASSNWLFSSFSYVGISIVWLAAFLSSLGATAGSAREAKYGAVMGTLLFCSAVAIVTLAMVGNISEVNGAMVPMLVLAKKVSPALAQILTVIIYAGIYTASVPLLWTASSRFTREGTAANKITVLGLVVLAAVIALAVPFDKLMNVIYVLSGYIGFLLLGFMLVKNILDGRKRRQNRKKANAD